MPKNFEQADVLLQSLRKGDNAAFEYLYRRYFVIVSTLVRRNGGTGEDAREIFQETMMALFKILRDKADFALSAEWSTFIYAIARNQWMIRLRKSSKNPESYFEDTRQYETIADDFDETALIAYDAKHQRIKTVLESMKAECRDIIEAAFYKKLPGAEIARLLGYTEAFVKVKKFRCMEELKKRVLA
jgi:RNA polymerase sigma factor (sigma-70 family)